MHLSINQVVQNFILQCDNTLQSLQTAQTVESLDAATSNNSFSGFLISTYSHSSNHAAADRVDALWQEAMRINMLLQANGMLNGMIFPLSTDFNGNAIRQAENSEHNILMDWLSSSWYSSIGSMNTLNMINHTISKVQQVRQQAIFVLQTTCFQPQASTFSQTAFPNSSNLNAVRV